MKRKKTVCLLMGAVAVSCAAAGLAACKHVHEWGEWEVTPATCTESGGKKRSCLKCGEEETQPLAATGHEWSGWQTDENGHKKICLNDCGEEKDAGAHVFGANNACNVCGYTLAYTQSLAYTALYAEGDEEETTPLAYAVAGFEEDGERVANVVVPAYHEGLPVTKIGNMAFYDSEAKRGEDIESIALPETVTEIGFNAFTSCASLSKINLENVETIGSSAFWGTAFTELILPESIKTTEGYIFYDCPSLKEVTVRAHGTFGNYAFWNCTALERVTLSGAATFGEGAFYGCTALTEVTIDSNGVLLGEDSFANCADASIDFTFTDAVTEIGKRALGTNLFSKLPACKSLTLGKNVEKIGEEGLSYLTNLKTLVLPEGLTELGAKAFDSCKALESVIFPASLVTVGPGAFSTCKAITKVEYAGTVSQWAQIDFGNTLSTPLRYGAALFADGKEVKDVVIERVETVKCYAFFGAALESVTLGAGVTKVEQEAFARDSSSTAAPLQKVVILEKTVEFNPLCFNYALSDDTEIYYCGTAAEMEENVLYEASNVHYFKKGKHYFYSEERTQETVTTDGRWTFGGFWHFANDGVTPEKWETV